MACISPPELGDDQLLKHLDGQADPSVEVHLNNCDYCLQRAARLRELDRTLTTRLYRVSCPSPHELGEYHLQQLSKGNARIVAAHVADCLRCRDELASLQVYLDELRPEIELSIQERVQVLFARLLDFGISSNEPNLTPALAGIRGEAGGPMVYQIDQIQIVIEVERDPGHPRRWRLLGLVTGMSFEGLECVLVRDGEVFTSIHVDDLGNFILEKLTPGILVLYLRNLETEVHLPPIEIG